MAISKCEICGGTVIVNVDSASGICDSCGRTADLDRETLSKYSNILKTAERQMQLNSVKGYTAALGILEDIPFVDGVQKKKELCVQRMEEIKEKQEKRVRQAKKSDSGNTALGIVLAVICIAVVVALVGGCIFLVYKYLKGELSPTVAKGAGIAALVIIGLTIAGSFGNQNKQQ